MTTLAEFLLATCSTDGCDLGGKLTRGICSKHYRNWLDHTPKDQRPPAPRFNRDFWDYVDKSGECWVWTGPRNRGGYGYWSNGPESGLAHRVSLTRVTTPQPSDIFACHRCDNPPCVNPRHLYWGTVRDNTDDRSARGGVWNKGKYSTMCPQGHDLTQADNLKVYNGKRFCRPCGNERARTRMAELATCPTCGQQFRKSNISRHRRNQHG
jgi:hypothetical protein